MVPKDKKATYDQILAPANPVDHFPRSEHRANVELMYGLKLCFLGGAESHNLDWVEREGLDT